MKKSSEPFVIKVAVTVTALPRWVLALLVADGFILPPTWSEVASVVSAVFGVGMAFVEAWAIAYIWSAVAFTRETRRSRTLEVLLALTILTMIGALGLQPCNGRSVTRRN